MALAHDWLCGYRGGEAVLERLAVLVEERFEPAGLYVMFDDGGALSPEVDRWRERGLTRASPLNRVPGGPGRLRRWLLPLYPSAVAHLSGLLRIAHRRAPIDVLVSSSSAAIKGLEAPEGVPHLCYCHSPARYVWSRRADYGGRDLKGMLRGAGLRLVSRGFKAWDRRTASRVSRFIANSTHTARLVRECYGAEAAIVHPPVRTGFFTPDPAALREDLWLVVSALEPYKRVDLAIGAARLAGRHLVIAGTGSQRRALERLVRRGGSGVEFRGRVSDEELRSLYRRAAALIFPQVEDFGIVAAEALACGLPVVARAEGGALDIVEDGVSGALFRGATAGAVVEAASRLPRDAAGPCRARAERFSERMFDESMSALIAAAVSIRRGRA